MSSLTYTVADSTTMLRRNLKHQLRYPSLTLMLAGFPIVFLLLFVYVFGGQLGTGLGGTGVAQGSRSAYLTYVVPGILIITVASAALGTAISVATDMTQRHHRPLPHHVHRPSRRAHRPRRRQPAANPRRAGPRGRASRWPSDSGTSASPLAWLAAAAILLLFAFALIWLSAALGLAAKSVETASNTPMFLTLLPFLSSGFVPTNTLPAGLRQFAEVPAVHPCHQTVRGLLTGGPVGTHAVVASRGAHGIALASYLWAIRLYDRRRAAGPR